MQQAARRQRTFEQQWKKRNLWCLHLLKGVPVGFVIQWWILWRHFQIKQEQRSSGIKVRMHVLSELTLLQHTELKHNLVIFFLPMKHTYCDGLQFGKELLKFPRNFLWKLKTCFLASVSCLNITNIVEKWPPYLPCLTQAADGCSVQTHYNSKKTAKVLLSFTAIKKKERKREESMKRSSARGHAVHLFTTGGSNIPF